MPRKYNLTWQPGTRGRAGRWKKKYKGQVYYFPGGRGKSDRDAYAAALTKWEQMKPRLDALASKPYQADYEREIQKWDAVVAWCRSHGEDEMARTAILKQEVLRSELSAAKPSPVRKEDTFDGQFDWSVRFPDYDKSIEEFGAALAKAEETSEPGLGLPGYEEYLAATTKFIDGVIGNSSANSAVIVPAELHDFDKPDPLKVAREIWSDRLEVMQRSATPIDRTIGSHVELFLDEKKGAAKADEVTEGRVYTLQLHLTHFMDWVGRESPVVEISGRTLSDYRVELLQNVEKQQWSRTTANNRLNSVKSFVRWLWQIDAIPSLPRNMRGTSNALTISKPSPPIVVFEKQEISTLLKQASERTKLYILLMLNCGMTQKDIADLDMSEVDWESGRIRRRRSKTRKSKNVPVVDYLLWPETLRLLLLARNPAETGPVLLNENGRPLWYEEITADGKYRRKDNVRKAFDRLREKTGINKPPKSLKKTSASLIRSNGRYDGLEGLFLGHAPGSMADKHYTVAPQTLFDEAITWLGTEYGL